jgi:small subunit ribosomal protein S20
MANHKSSLKRIRQNETRQEHNRYLAKTMRNALRDFRKLTDKKELEEKYPKLVSTIDKLVKLDIIHKNKAANLKSQISKKVKTA